MNRAVPLLDLKNEVLDVNEQAIQEVSQCVD